jgi:hypothetical protein
MLLALLTDLRARNSQIGKTKSPPIPAAGF